MKAKIIFLFLLLLTIFTACEPIEDRQDAGNVLKESELIFNIIQETTGSNTVIFENKTPGILPFFDWGSGFSNKAQAEAYFPFAGTYSVTFTAYCAGGNISTSKEFTVNQNDPAYFNDPAWNLISGNGSGKTWIFAADIPSSNFGGRIWGNGGYLDIPSGPNWWGRTFEDAKDDEIDLNAELYFDLDGAAHMKTISNGTTTTGNYDLKLNEKVMTSDGQIWAIGSIEFSGVTIPHGISQNEGQKPVYKFDICTLTENELVLCYNTEGNRTQGCESWYWRFKRKGFNY